MAHSTPSQHDLPRALRAFALCLLAVHVGLLPADAQLLRDGSVRIDQDDFGHPERIDDHFGAVLAAGDFNCDGRADVVFGVPEYDTQVPGPPSNQGHVIVAYGGSDSTWVLDMTFDQDFGFGESGENDDDFGAALAVGNFDGAGCDDLAVGVPGEGLSIVTDEYPAAGIVHILYGYGFTGGLSTLGTEKLSKSPAGQLLSLTSSGERLGSVLAAGDFNGDGRDDLALGMSRTDVGATLNTGSIQVIYGSPSGIDPAEVLGVQEIFQSDLGGLDETNDGFGAGLVAADFDGDGACDLAVVAPGKSIGGTEDAGAVYVLYGGAGGLDLASSQLLHRDTPGVPGQPAGGEGYGSVSTAGDFDGDGRFDLVLRAPGEAASETKGTNGSDAPTEVHVLFGSAAGLTTDGLQVLTAATAAPEQGDDKQFGSTLAAGDFDSDGRHDLVLGTPWGAVSSAAWWDGPEPGIAIEAVTGTGIVAGEVYVVRGLANRTFDPQTVLDQGAGVEGELGNGQFGDGLVAADVNGDGTDDLVVGNSLYDSKRGTAFLFYGSSELFSDGFESGDSSRWTSQVGG